MSAPTKYENTPTAELISMGEQAGMHSPLIAELTRRLSGGDLMQQMVQEKVVCPVCEATLLCHHGTEDSYCEVAE